MIEFFLEGHGKLRQHDVYCVCVVCGTSVCVGLCV